MEKNNVENFINSIMSDIGISNSSFDVSKDEISDTIANILHQYNLSTDMSFVEKVAKIKFDDKNESIALNEMPQDLQDAAFLPINTQADIALREDIDLIISQLPEWFSAIQITRDAVCEADVVTGRLSRDIVFSNTKLDDNERSTNMGKIEEVEERLGLHSIIKNHIVANTIEYGEGYMYIIPYAKVFEDMYRYRLKSKTKKNNQTMSMFSTSTTLNGYGYGEGVEISLKDTIIQEQNVSNQKGIFTEAEIMEIRPDYHSYNDNMDMSQELKEQQKKFDSRLDEVINNFAENIHYIKENIALPVIEESAHDLHCVYHAKYANKRDEFIQETDSIFKEVMNSNIDDDGINSNFKNIKGVYTKILPPTKLIPLRIDREVIGYYYISDLTRPENEGERKNSGLSGYTLRSPSLGFDTLQPDQMFCEKLASKIINNFDLKFMRDNTSVHKEIVAILQSHKFNESLMRFVFIPAENIIQCTINKDGLGKGHSMLEGGLVTARMYMFLKLYSLLYQINNSQVRIYNLRMSGIDKDYQNLIQETMRKFSQRRVTANDIFNYRSSMNKVSGGSELMMPLGASGDPPITFETLDPVNSPINNELLDQIRNESINATPVPSLMVQTGGQSEIEFAKETELANTRFNTLISSIKIDLNPDITRMYRIILRWETDIDPDIIKELKFVFRNPMSKELNVTVEMVNNFNSLSELAINVFVPSSERKDPNGEDTEIVREFKKVLLHRYIPSIDIEEFNNMYLEAKHNSNKSRLALTAKGENILGDEQQQEEV